MTTIYTFTPNPCIDKNVEVPVLQPDKKLQCAVISRQPGGGGINVARVVKRLGMSVTAIFPAGDSNGRMLGRLVEQEGVNTAIIDTTAATRENIMLIETATHRQYRLGMPGESLSKDEWRRCEEVIRATEELNYLVVSGSMPGNTPRDQFQRIAAIASEKQARLVVDAAGDMLHSALQAGVWMIKPNLSELAALVGKKELNEYQAIREAQLLIQKKQCKVVVISMDARGAILVSEDECYRAIPPVVKPQSSVGAGDSMVGGMMYSLNLGHSLEEALKMGIACGAAAIMNPGTTLCKTEDVGLIFKEVQVSRLSLTTPIDFE